MACSDFKRALCLALGVNFGLMIKTPLTARLKTHNDCTSYLDSQINCLGISAGFDVPQDFRTFFWHGMVNAMFVSTGTML
jgi:hypothetical protein